MPTKPMRPALLALFCVVAVLLLPLTVLCAVLAAMGGDASLLRVLRGKNLSEG